MTLKGREKLRRKIDGWREIAIEKATGKTIHTIKRLLSREKTCHKPTIYEVFQALGLEVEETDIEITNKKTIRGCIMDEKVLKLWRQYEERGEVATIYTYSLNPQPFRFSVRTNIGIPDPLVLSRVSHVAALGAWWGKQDILKEYLTELKQEGSLFNYITRGSVWEVCSASEAPQLDDPIWQPIFPNIPGLEVQDKIALGQNSLAWLLTKTESGWETRRTNPKAEYLNKEIHYTDSFRVNLGVELVAS